MVQSTFVSFVVLDLLLLSHSLIFTITNLIGGDVKYAESNALLNTVAPYGMLTPLLGIQILWLSTCLTAVISLKAVLPYLQLPYLLCSGLVLATFVWLIARLTTLIVDADTVTWPMIVLLCAMNLVFLVQIYFLYVKLVCFKMLIRKRKLVSTMERNLGKFGLGSLPNNDQFDTYSTKSTVIVTDDYLNRVP
ncbi:unnamed protein product [Bursaphelenchus okinawaensis]|uniref:Uncharacterized protein n=1 Tax=Bursaphelenchus okinawaensis TaxID=465554 RepID=A0A811LLD3_9BILA|nr:unnamed protein product [Bursaphelenchus okinawaensis]CAG9127753.1 unnamed protein product [Bursaphelenchus okinawaensis]